MGLNLREKWPNVDYEQLLELHGSLVDANAALCAKGKQALESGNINEAIEIYSKVLKTNPIDEAALCGLALVYQTDGKMDKTIDAYKRLCRLIHHSLMPTITLPLYTQPSTKLTMPSPILIKQLT